MTHPLSAGARLAEIEREILARAPETDIVPTLDRVRAVMDLLGDPQRAFRVIHVTGTNGKTSTARFIEAVCRELGLRTGRFTSPHLHSMRERISVDGEPVAPEVFVETWDQIRPVVELVDQRFIDEGGPRMTFFEVLAVLGYAIFADAPVEVAVVEVGMGGTWDATNVADGDVAVVTPVAVDHTRFLGSTPAEIAQEKAGIVKSGALVVVGAQDDDVADVIREQAVAAGARVYAADLDFGLTGREVAVGGQVVSLRGLAGDYDDLFLPVHGPHQADNVALAVAAVEAFVGGGERRIDPDVLRAALAGASAPGRLEPVRQSPTILVDAAHNPHGIAAHNPHGMRALADALSDAFTFTRLVGAVAIFADKDASSMLEALEPVLDHVVVTRNTSPRSMDPAELGELAADLFGSGRVSVVPALPDALEEAVTLAEQAGIGGGVIVTGSVVTAADVRALLGVTSS